MATEKKRMMYIGYMGDRNTPWIEHGLRFDKGVVQPVSQEVYEWLKHNRWFREVIEVRNTLVDYPGKNTLMAGSESYISQTIGSRDVETFNSLS